MVRFTPRRTESIWSAVNIARVKVLRKQGLMTPAGLEAFQNRNPRRSQRYSFEQATVAFSPQHLRAFKSRASAWAYFEQQPPSYRKMATMWVLSAKKDDTRKRRMEILIKDSATGVRIAPLRRKSA